MKSELFGQLCSKQREYLRRTNRTIDESAIFEEIHGKFEASWVKLSDRLRIVPGKRVVSLLNNYLQNNFSVTEDFSVSFPGSQFFQKGIEIEAKEPDEVLVGR
jgi:hypothetical protein